MPAAREVPEVLAADDHLIARVGEQQSARGRLQAKLGGDERHHHDGDDDSKAQLAHRRLEDGDDRVLVAPGQHRADVRDREHQPQAHPERGRAADVDRQAHRLWNLATGVRRFLGDVPTGLEAVVAEHRR